MAKAKVIEHLDADAPTGQNARIIARTRLEEMYSWDMYVDNPYNVRGLHNLRIAAKRLRYTLEIFFATFPEECAAILKEVERIQEELGSLHDSDVMIALLRLCLGSQDSGSGYEYALTAMAPESGKGEFIINPELVTYLLNPDAAPPDVQRQGLEILLSDLQQQREAQYASFRSHWYQLKGRNFQQEILSMLDA
jgi:CHAD domain